MPITEIRNRNARQPSSKAGYRLVVLRSFDLGPRLQVFNSESGIQVFDWHGYTARYIINQGELDGYDLRQYGCYPCSKGFACHLALVAAAAQVLHSRLPTGHRYVSRVLVGQPNEHLCANDVQQLLLLEVVDMALTNIKECLDDLVRWNWIQRIKVDANLVFYDIDTRPHDHIFDPDTQRIYDAYVVHH